MKHRWSFLILLCVLPFLALAQEKKEPTYSTFDRILQIDKKPLRTPLRLPMFTIGTGVVSFHGNVTNGEPANFSIGCNGIHFEMQQRLTPTLRFGIRYLYSELRENEYFPSLNTYYSFKTEVNSFGAFAVYSFSRPKLQRKHILTPYLSLGVSILQRPEARADWQADGKKLHLWSDGTFRDKEETPHNASTAKVLYQDYNYETSLQKENGDNRDFYTPIIATVPIEFGVTYNISSGIKLNFGYQYHISMTNTLDDVTKKSPEVKKVNRFPDGFSYAYVSLSTDLSQFVRRNHFDTYYNEEYYTAWDADGDGIDETDDDCPYTPQGVEVFANGCPFDDDNDGIPNYKDEEIMTQAFFHDEKGNGMTEEELRERLTKGERLGQDELYVHYPELLNGSTITHSTYKKIPKKFKDCDSDKNEFIDLDELLNTINAFFDSDKNAGFGSNLTSKDISELIEFFFLQ